MLAIAGALSDEDVLEEAAAALAALPPADPARAALLWAALALRDLELAPGAPSCEEPSSPVLAVRDAPASNKSPAALAAPRSPEPAACGVGLGVSAEYPRPVHKNYPRGKGTRCNGVSE